jgi:hypothetical protein
MEHTKKFVLVDPRFVRPSMRDKALSGLDSDISNILNSDDSDEIKAKNYVSALSRFKAYSSPPKPEKREAVRPPPPPPPVPFKALSPPKRAHKRFKADVSGTVPSFDPPPEKRTLRKQTKKKIGSQWVEYSGSPTKRSTPIKLHNWVEQ